MFFHYISITYLKGGILAYRQFFSLSGNMIDGKYDSSVVVCTQVKQIKDLFHCKMEWFYVQVLISMLHSKTEQNFCKAFQFVQNLCWGFLSKDILVLSFLKCFWRNIFPFIALGVCKTQKEQGNNWDWIVSIIF